MLQQHGQQTQQGGTSVLSQYGLLMNDYTERYDELVGREREVDQLISTLYQRKKPNPVLVGEAGVGKTQIIEGVVRKIKDGEVMGKLEDAYIYDMDVKKLSGDLQKYGKSLADMLIKEVNDNASKGNPTILFMDEMHLLVGSVSQSNPNAENPADVLKPALARGDLRVIGATTIREYRNIEVDKALERRFSPIYVDELSHEDTLLVLEGARTQYEEFHGVTYGEEVFETSIELASRYMPERAFPDKALDVIDKVGAKMSSSYDQEGLSFEQERLDYEGTVALLNMSRNLVNNHTPEVNRWGREFEQVVESQEELAQQENTDRKLITKLDVRNFVKDSQGLETLIEEYTESEIIEEFTNRLVGQDEAVNAVASHMILSNYGFRNKDKPKSTLLFYGATGVGKSEMAKQISRVMFGSEELLTIDGGEFQERHTVSKLVGSPAGYVGYGSSTPFDSLRRKPNQVVLIDEFDKMHSDVKQLFLGILEEGRLRDGSGNVIPFNETVIIFTTNERPSQYQGETTVGFNMAQTIEQSLAMESDLFEDRPQFDGMSPELVNRFDEVINFNDMTLEMVERIFDIKFGDFQRLAYEEHQWTVNITDPAREHLIRASFNPTFGARPINRNITKLESMVVRNYGNYKASHNGEEKDEFNIVERDGKVVVL